ncbi:hypothetical protein [Enterococcus sp. AZ007]|uniref:hypothetical protein n=1 Tax=Enterococcus sp. AZ007 TaxID=2774839 RepID=UPI003F693C9A
MNLYRQLIEAGWTVQDIENSNYNRLIQVVCTKVKKEKPKEVPLKDFLKTI